MDSIPDALLLFNAADPAIIEAPFCVHGLPAALKA